MQSISNEISYEITEISDKLNIVQNKCKTLNATITKYKEFIGKINESLRLSNDNPRNCSGGGVSESGVFFTFPSFNQQLKKSDQRALELCPSSSLISIDFLNKIKLDERGKLLQRLDSIIANNKPYKAALSEIIKRLDQCRISISGVKSRIKEARRQKINLLIKQNESLGCDRLNPLYNLLENNAVKLEADSTLYFDSSSIKSMLKELEVYYNEESQLIKESEYVKWNRDSNVKLEGNGIVLGKSKRVGYPIIYSSKEELDEFEAIILTGYKNRLESLSLRAFISEFENCKKEESRLEAELSGLKGKMSHVKYLPECRRMQAYEKMLSLTASSTIPGASTV